MVRINLLPPEYRPQPQIKPLRLLLLLLLIVAPIVLSGGVIYCSLQIRTLRSEIAAIQQERAELGPLYDEVLRMEKTLNSVQAKLGSIEKVTANHLRPLELFSALNSVMPQSVTIDSLTLASGGAITIRGSASDYYGVAALQLKMIVSEAFSGTVLSNASGEETVSFQLTSTYVRGSTGPLTRSPYQAAASAQNVNVRSGSAAQGDGLSPAAGSDDAPSSDQGGLE